jgi:hypothetical protein
VSKRLCFLRIWKHYHSRIFSSGYNTPDAAEIVMWKFGLIYADTFITGQICIDLWPLSYYLVVYCWYIVVDHGTIAHIRPTKYFASSILLFGVRLTPSCLPLLNSSMFQKFEQKKSIWTHIYDKRKYDFFVFSFTFISRIFSFILLVRNWCMSFYCSWYIYIPESFSIYL